MSQGEGGSRRWAGTCGRLSADNGELGVRWEEAWIQERAGRNSATKRGAHPAAGERRQPVPCCLIGGSRGRALADFIGRHAHSALHALHLVLPSRWCQNSCPACIAFHRNELLERVRTSRTLPCSGEARAALRTSVREPSFRMCLL